MLMQGCLKRPLLEPEMELGEVIRLCEFMEHISIKYGSLETSLDLSRHVRKLRIELRQVETAGLMGQELAHVVVVTIVTL
jgi:hypothetical protein